MTRRRHPAPSPREPLAVCLVLAALGAAPIPTAVPHPGASSASAQQPPAMQAVVVEEFGSPDVLRVREAPRPGPGEDELLVRVHAAGVNPVDAGARSGRAAGLVGAELPYVPGFDVSGVVEAVGPGVDAFRPGDEVFAMIDLRRGGGYAEYAVVRVDEAAPRPAGVSYLEAASLPLVALTAWQALFETAELEPGQQVLIHGGAGGVGSIAVQMAVGRGARVIATASPRNHEFLRGLGAHVVVDYNTERFEEYADGVDLVLDPIGGETQVRSLGVLGEGGVLVSLVGLTPEAGSPPEGVRATSILVSPDAGQLTRIARLVEEGTLRPVVTHTFPLARAPEAHRQSETGHTRGKIVLEVVREPPPGSRLAAPLPDLR